MRTGNEPATARSPLRLRLGLAIFGAVACSALAIVFGVTGHTGWAVIFGVIAFVACVNTGVVIARIRQGPHFQPGPDIPPYEAPRPVSPPRPAHPLRPATRKRLYFVLMGACLLLVVLAWTVIYHFSTTAAVIMSVIALVIPPFAVMIANAGEPRDPPADPRDEGHR